LKDFLFILKNSKCKLRIAKEITIIINTKYKMFYLISEIKMIKVEFLGPIGIDSLELDIKTLKELSIYMQKNSELKEWIDISAVAVNDTLISNLDYKLKDGDVVSILPPVCGG
jgi:molybdopterin synthase sulfur carrier subunit